VRKLRDRMGPLEPDDFLRLAVGSQSPAAAGEFAKRGLKSKPSDLDPEGAVLLLREVFRAHLHEGRPRSAHAVARKMVRLGALPEVTHADLGRACAALGWWGRASQAYRIAARFAPARRRALHWAACASALHHGQRHDEALAALERAIRWSTGTRPLHRAYAALVQLDQGHPVPDLETIVHDLELARCGEGYGRYVLGLLALAGGDARRARKYLREFVHRNIGDPMREATLAAEIARARKTLRDQRVARQT
jgi:tetratricopeptide (TPR) repeat protein